MKNTITSILLSLILIASFCISTTSAWENDIKGKTAPNFTLFDLNGKKVSLSDFKGKVVIIDFWATWCPPCVREIPHFIELYEEYKDKGFAMVGISVDRQGINVVKAFSQRFKINYPILMADNQVVRAYGNITGIPTTFVIDPSGNFHKMYIGYRSKSVFETDIKKLLPDVKLTESEQKESETTPNKYVNNLNKIGIAGRPESDNAAPYYLRAIDLFVKQPEDLMVETKTWPNELSEQQQKMLKKWVHDNSKALEQLQLASQKPYCWHKINSETISASEMSNLKTMKPLVWALHNRAMLSSEDGNITSAFNDIETLYRIGSQMSEGPKTVILKLTGIVIKNISINLMFNMLDRQMLDAKSMKTFEDRFKQIVSDNREPYDIRGEKIFLQELTEIEPEFRSFKPYLKSTLEYYDTLAIKSPIQLRNETQSITDSNPLIKMMPGIPRLIELEYQSRTNEQALITTLAILRYNSDKNRFPSSLSELISAGYIKEIPIDPYSNQPLVYKRTQEGFTLYSFGEDYDDDGGQHSNWGKGEKGGDQVFWPIEKNP